jgi:hypothetical protein
MKIARLVGPPLLSVLAVGLMAAPTALALPEFSTTKAAGSTTSATSKLVAISDSVECKSNAVEGGEIVTRFLVGPFRVRFLECTSSGAGGTGCTAKSTNTTVGGAILTNTLHSFLVLQTLTSGAHRTWLLTLPVGTNAFVTLASNKCTPESKVTGEVGGVVSPLLSKRTTGKVQLAKTEQNEALGETFEGGEVGAHEYRGLAAFTVNATEELEESVTSSEAEVEVT